MLEKEGSPLTFPADAPDREIDFVMGSGTTPATVLEHRVVDDASAADHRPTLAVLQLLGGR